MRRRSRTNSHPWRDDAFNEEYRRENPFDEIARYFPKWDRGWTTIPGTPATHVSALDTPRDHVHHIAHGHSGNRRWDTRWNLICLSWHAHSFVHAFPVDGLALCLQGKIRKREWDHEAARQRLGCDLIGFLSGKVCEYPFAEKIRKKLVKERFG